MNSQTKKQKKQAKGKQKKRSLPRSQKQTEGYTLPQGIKRTKLDGWQTRALKRRGNIVLRCGRQVGKSFTTALKAYNMVWKHPESTTLVLAASQRQASLMFEKIYEFLEMDNRARIEEAMANTTEDLNTTKKKREFEAKHSIFESEPTQTRIKLKNGSQIFCVPTGQHGALIRGFTPDFLIVDEAPYVNEKVWEAITPMLSTRKKMAGTGWMILLGTPLGKKGFFYRACNSKDFYEIHVTSEKCPRISKDFLAKEKAWMTEAKYKREYLAEFLENYSNYFPDELIRKVTKKFNFEFKRDYSTSYNYFIGVDVARFGGDENAFVIVEQRKKDLRVVRCDRNTNQSISQTIGKIQELHKKFNFKKILVDGGGVGGGVVDILKERLKKRKVMDINNASRSIEEKNKGILKQDLYSNLLVKMENGEITIPENARLISSLKSIEYEYNEDGKLLIKGKGSHLCEALVRAVWGTKNKGLRLFAY